MAFTRAELIFYAYCILMNLMGIIAMKIDKKKAKNKKWRISENSLISIAIFGGSVGILFGMIFFKHKLNKNKFKFGVPTIYLLEKLAFIIVIHMQIDIDIIGKFIG